MVERYPSAKGFTVEVRADGEQGLDRALSWLPYLVCAPHHMLPGLDGLEVCRRLRPVAPIPVVMLTARASEDHRVAGLELGAYYYLPKPFSPRELTARVKAVLRRANGTVPTAASSACGRGGDLKLDRVADEVRRNGERLALYHQEVPPPGPSSCATRTGPSGARSCWRPVWGWHVWGHTATVTVHAAPPAREGGARPAPDPRHLRTVWGVGYRFEP